MIVDFPIESVRSLQNLTFESRGAGSSPYTPAMLRLCGQYLGILYTKSLLGLCTIVDFVQFTVSAGMTHLFGTGKCVVDTAVGLPRQAPVSCTLAFWKLLLGEALQVSDYESFDPQGYQSRIRYVVETEQIEDSGLDLTFIAVADDGTEVPLVPGGENIVVTDANKERYVRLWCRYTMGGAVASSMSFVKDGFTQLIPVRPAACPPESFQCHSCSSDSFPLRSCTTTASPAGYCHPIDE